MPGRPYPIAADERDRLAELVRYRVLDTAPEPVFDETVKLARSLFGVSTSVVSLIDDDRQWFKARAGIDACGTGRSEAFCTYAILSDDVMVVPDARADPRFAANPLVTGAPFIRFYAGAPLTTPAGYNIGTLCIFDPAPRPEGLGALDRRHLAMLARIVIERLEMRRIQLERDADAQTLHDVADRLVGAATGLDDQADTLAALARDGADRSGEAALGVRHLVSIGEEVNRDVLGVSDDIAAATANAQVVRTTVGGMKAHIGDIVSVASQIAEIALQTKMLAVNASIEAAHAGGAGRGFAVIAHEIRALATNTAEATDHIHATLQAVERTVTQSVGRCDDLVGLISEMNSRSETIRSAAAVSMGTHRQVGDGIGEIVGMARGVGSQAGAVRENAATLLDEAETLRTHARRLMATWEPAPGNAGSPPPPRARAAPAVGGARR